jgi:hypothetical protein
MISLVSVNARRAEREAQKMPLLFYLPLIIWIGLFEVAQRRNAGSRQSQGVAEDPTMTDRDDGLNRLKVLEYTTSREIRYVPQH